MTDSNNGSFTGSDYLQVPPHQIERQTTPSDISFTTQLMLEHYFKQMRDELCKQNPNVLAETVVQFDVIRTANYNYNVTFQVGGKPVTVYKTYIWSQSAKTIRASIAQMSSASDGFTVSGTPQLLHVPLTSINLTVTADSVLGVNVGTSQNTDGSVFVYGFTIPNYPDNF